MIARIDARVAEGNAVIFLTYHLHQCAHRTRCGMKISARNRLKDRIVDVKEGASPANVKIKVGGGIIRMRFTVEQLKLARGKPLTRSSRRAISWSS
jgi:molybdopterin-binding protein